MNEELENQLAKVVEKALQVAEQTGEFVIDQAPDLLREFYLWHTAQNILWILVCFIVFFAIYFIGKSMSKKEQSGYHDTKFFGRYYDEDALVPYSVISIMVGLIFFLVFLFTLFDLIKIIIAPKLYLIEHFL